MAACRPSAEPHRAAPFSGSLISAKENAPRSRSALLLRAITTELIVRTLRVCAPDVAVIPATVV